MGVKNRGPGMGSKPSTYSYTFWGRNFITPVVKTGFSYCVFGGFLSNSFGEKKSGIYQREPLSRGVFNGVLWKMGVRVKKWFPHYSGRSHPSPHGFPLKYRSSTQAINHKFGVPDGGKNGVLNGKCSRKFPNVIGITLGF